MYFFLLLHWRLRNWGCFLFLLKSSILFKHFYPFWAFSTQECLWVKFWSTQYLSIYWIHEVQYMGVLTFSFSGECGGCFLILQHNQLSTISLRSPRYDCFSQIYTSPQKKLKLYLVTQAIFAIYNFSPIWPSLMSNDRPSVSVISFHSWKTNQGFSLKNLLS